MATLSPVARRLVRIPELLAVASFLCLTSGSANDQPDLLPAPSRAKSAIISSAGAPANGSAGGRLWSLEPITRPPVPVTKYAGLVRNPIDAFILARLELAGLEPAPESDRATLIRRLSFDLLGLPPSPDDTEAFLRDPTPDAFEALAERMLSSPHYGERWGRHWLDVVRYTESQGFEYDRLRDNAWHYRDYVIASFNSDKPYDQFIREQIAGDAIEPLSPDKLVATGLLVSGPWDEAGNNQANLTQRAITREEELEELVSVVGQTFLGMTVNCARCHAHKFDPIPQEDYYRIKAVFEGVRHGERTIATAEQLQAHEKKLAPLRARVVQLEAELAKLESDVRATVLAARQSTPVPSTLPPSPSASEKSITPDELQGAMSAQVKSERTRLLGQLEAARAALKAVAPLPVSYIGTRKQPEPTRLLKRGDVTSPDAVVTPGGLSAVPAFSGDLGLSADAPEAKRRIRFADWIADSRNPLTARVMVNRLWHYHFGSGLVATPNDFGNSGAKPSHPELLDWLASRFVESGWSVKTIQRLIVSSATYRQSSRFHQNAAAVDAENQWLWRFSPRRLEAEAIRDAMLAASGEIELAARGPGFRPFEIIKFNSSSYVPVDKVGAEFNRRTVYRVNVNSGKDPLLDAFDCPDPSVKTPRRSVTTTPLQALMLMNDPFVQRQATQLAAHALKDSHGDLTRAIGQVYRRTLGRPPTDREIGQALRTAGERGLWHVCWTLFNSTEFLYVQ